ncbi:MAG TPA: M66 family metalloprotease [Propionicimonas sp.]
MPDPGWTVTASAATVASIAAVADVTMSRAASGEVAIIVYERTQGAPQVYGDSAVAADVLLERAARVTATPASTNPKCDNYSYNIGYGQKWVGTFRWYQKSGISIPYAAIAGGINAMADGTGARSNLQNGATASYQGTTTVPATFSSSGLCNSTDLTNVIDTGTLPVGWLAGTCTYANASEISYADVRFNTGRYAWYTGVSGTGCTAGKFDAQGTMTHEAGHVFGLGHVANTTLQVMKTNGSECDVAQRLLGPGDLAGMKALYP